MPALNFQKQFATAVESGEKRRTIRAHRKGGRDPRVGDTLYLYTGMRHPSCRKLGEAVCTGADSVLIDPGSESSDGIYWDAEIRVSNRPVDDMDEFAAADGFKKAADMFDFFQTNHGAGPFDGLLIRWGEFVEHGEET